MDLQKIFKEEIDDRRFTAGANLLVLKNGKELIYEEYGYRDLENKVPFSRDTIVRLYSMSKPITAAAVMILVDRGQLDLSNCLAWFMPGFKPAHMLVDGKRVKTEQEITVKDLMNMTSGIPYPGGEGAWAQSAEIFSDINRRMYTDDPVTTAEFAQRVGGCDLCFNPGDKFMYGASADVLGAVVEQVSGMLFGEFANQVTDFDDLLWVKTDSRLIENENLGIPCKSTGY